MQDSAYFDSRAGSDQQQDAAVVTEISEVIDRLQTLLCKCKSTRLTGGIEELAGNIVILDDISHRYLPRNMALGPCNSELKTAPEGAARSTRFSAIGRCVEQPGG